MEKYLIGDSRLTPTMERVRSGNIQIFTEKGSKESEEIELVHDRKEMYAALIDGKWYWINGCDKCNNTIEKYCYMRCEKHDVCVSCGIKRAELTEVPWGHSEGFLCKPCAESKRLEAKREAFDKLEGEEPDTRYQSDIVCPHCGTILNSDDVHENTEMECGICLGELDVEVIVTLDYTTSIKGERIKP